jgi:hypothetical protein
VQLVERSVRISSQSQDCRQVRRAEKPKGNL